MHDNFMRLGPPGFDDQDRQLAQAFQDTCTEEDVRAAYRRHGLPVEAAPLHDGIVPLEAKGRGGVGSTDVGDVSWVVPTVQAWGATCAIGTPFHSWQFTGQGKTAGRPQGPRTCREGHGRDRDRRSARQRRSRSRQAKDTSSEATPRPERATNVADARRTSKPGARHERRCLNGSGSRPGQDAALRRHLKASLRSPSDAGRMVRGPESVPRSTSGPKFGMILTTRPALARTMSATMPLNGVCRRRLGRLPHRWGPEFGGRQRFRPPRGDPIEGEVGLRPAAILDRERRHAFLGDGRPGTSSSARQRSPSASPPGSGQIGAHRAGYSSRASASSSEAAGETRASRPSSGMHLHHAAFAVAARPRPDR